MIMNKKNTVDPINLLRVIAVFMVFFLHTSIFSSQREFVFSNHTWFLKTPAWGAVWIFFVLSGYLIGKGYYYKRYMFDTKGIISFYLSRFLKIGLPTWGFVFMCCVLVQPDFVNNNPGFLFKILTFTYDATPGFDGPSATWYVSTLMQLYLVAPFLCRGLQTLFSKIKDTKKRYMTALFLMFCCILLGFSFRYYGWKCGVDWSSKIYVPFYMNLDLYISGILINYLLPQPSIENAKSSVKKICAFMVLLGFVLFNTWIYYKEYYFVYQYVFPSLYILVICFYIYINEKYKTQQSALTIQAICKNPLRLIDLFASIAFGFYLFHSLVLSRIYTLISGSTPAIIHIKLIIIAFIITLPFAWGFQVICRECSKLKSLIF